ncbi:MAG TPA: L,D-transpeptidase family protein, partial [Candidatus Saccharimonadales bacterium]|nr:L,D-transpeptidase family protein [Candidatus Saccharimonadales bacterium]
MNHITFAGGFALSLTLTTLGFGNAAFAITADEINAAAFSGALPEGQSALTAKLQVLLERAGAKPGVIDGVAGENVAKAIRSFEEIQGLKIDGAMNRNIWERLQSTEPVSMSYTVTADDVDKIVDHIPDDYAEKAAMKWLGYTSGAEALAEKFHMDQDFLEALNPGASFVAGEKIVVVNPGTQDKIEIDHIVADKSNERVVVYGKNDMPVIIYPATIGSDDTPSPHGTHEINGVKKFPVYAYNPEKNFQQGENSEKL